MEIILRRAVPEDACSLLEIYRPYVEKTAISFETLQPSYEDFVARITNTLKLYPYLVLCVNGNSVGYAYAGPFHSRSAYAWSCETSIYLRDTFCKMGVGRMLYQKAP